MTTQNNNTTPVKDSFMASQVRKVRRALAMKLAGEMFQVAPKDSVRLAGCVVYWFEQDGFKQFVTVKSKSPEQADGMVRFPSFFGLVPGRDACETVRAAMQVQLGKTFCKSVDPKYTGADRIAAVPTFNWHDASLDTQNAVQLLVWAVKVTPEQVKLIDTADDLEVKVIPEFAMQGKRVSQAHKLIYQSVQRHVAGAGNLDLNPMKLLEQLDKYMDGEPTPERTLH